MLFLYHILCIFFINDSIYEKTIMERMVYIYGLKNDGINEYRYIGKTIRPKYRLGEHLSEKSREFSVHKKNWINKSLHQNKKIILEIIEEVNENNWQEKEKFYIAYYRNQGHRLTNLLDGGNSPQMYKFNLSYDDAKLIARSLGIKTTLEWRNKSKNHQIPVNIPKRPDLYYSSTGWNGWSDWLGIEIIANRDKTFMKYDECKKIVHQLGFQNNIEWRKYCGSGLKPSNIPSNPDLTYKNNGWTNWYDFLNIFQEKKFRKKFLPYEEAKNFVSKLGLRSDDEWRNYSKTLRPSNIPSNPWKIYDEWEGILKFIGVNGIS